MTENKFIISAFSDEAGAPLAAQVDALCRNGIKGMEIRGVDGENIADISHAKLRDVRATLDGAGLCVYNVGSPVGKIAITDDFAPALDAFKRMLEGAHILGAQRMRIFSFYTEDGTHGAVRDEVMERMSALCEAARGSGVLLCHENERGIYGDTPERCLDLFTALPELKGVFDPANFLLMGVDVKGAWEKLAPYTEYLHIKDGLPEGRIVPPGEGTGEIPYVLSEFAARGGTHITLEPHLFEFTGLKGLEQKESGLKVGGIYDTPDEAFDAAVVALKNIISELR